MSKKFKILGGILVLLMLVWLFMRFAPGSVGGVTISENVREKVSRVTVALIAIIVGYVILILALPIVLKIGLLLVLGAVVYFAFRGLFKKEPEKQITNPNIQLIP